MFTLSKSNPELTFDSNAHMDLGRKLQDFGGRILLICSVNPKDKNSIKQLKQQLISFNFTFIQCDQPQGFISRDELNKLQIRAENFDVTSVIALGDLTQRMSGRFISQRLSLNYFELPTIFNNPYLLVPQAIFSNRVGNSSEMIYLASDRINGIDIDINFLRVQDDYDITLNSLSILLDLAHLFIKKENNIIAKTESRQLFLRLLTDLENVDLGISALYQYGLTAALYHGASSDIDLNVTIYSWIAGGRFKCDPNIISAKLLPWFLDRANEDELSLRVREILDKLGISCRLTDLGFTLKQLCEIESNNQDTISLVEKAF